MERSRDSVSRNNAKPATGASSKKGLVMSQVIDLIIGSGPRDGQVHLKMDLKELRQIEGRLLRASFLAAGVAVAALYAVDTFEPAPHSADQEVRIAPTPLF